MRLEMECAKCGRTYPVNYMAYRCVRCHYPLEVRYEVATKLSKKLIQKREWTIWRYNELLPIRDLSKVVSMGEGGTSLHKSVRLAERLDIKNLYLKTKQETQHGRLRIEEAALEYRKH